MPPSLLRSLSSQLSLDPSVDTVFSCLDVDICVDSVWGSISIHIHTLAARAYSEGLLPLSLTL